MIDVTHRFTEIAGHRIFYREAGHHDAAAGLLLHGAPASSHMFRHLIPLLADRYHVIAPDYLGFGLSDSPSVEEFGYSFDALTDITAELLDQLGCDRYAMYVQDYGAPVGWRLALRDPDRVSAIVTQNGNAYAEGFVPAFWDPL
jgi:pimeloyl-ACP methyl ester carboxylesterase